MTRPSGSTASEVIESGSVDPVVTVAHQLGLGDELARDGDPLLLVRRLTLLVRRLLAPEGHQRTDQRNSQQDRYGRSRSGPGPATAVHDLLGQGVGLLECARRLGWSLNTVKPYARAPTAEQLQRPPRYGRTLVDPYREHLRRQLAADPAVAVTRLLAEAPHRRGTSRTVQPGRSRLTELPDSAASRTWASIHACQRSASASLPSALRSVTSHRAEFRVCG